MVVEIVVIEIGKETGIDAKVENVRGHDRVPLKNTKEVAAATIVEHIEITAMKMNARHPHVGITEITETIGIEIPEVKE